MLQFDVAIIGGGLAGLSVALPLAQHFKIVIIAKGKLLEGASQEAQGGIAAVLDDQDSCEQHINDTLKAGADLCDETATRFIIEHSRSAIEWLIEQGVPFTKEDSNQLGYHLTREGGHSQRRIIHAADRTGLAVQKTLEALLRKHSNITILEHHCVVDLITSKKITKEEHSSTCLGCYVLDTQKDQVKTIAASYTVLATGGAGKVYNYTSNPDTATGDGIAMAFRSGCRVANMEFIQFHPTCLYHPHAKSFLISEALRGEGAVLKIPQSARLNPGNRFMPDYDSRAELAPRDIVARSIDSEMKKQGLDYVDLDISHQTPKFLKEHFPNILKKCSEFGIDITQHPIPVVPAAHYTCGGIVTDLNGCTDLLNLYAVGETAYTGLHGANRLASNSLLECIVLGRAAAEHILNHPQKKPYLPLPNWDESQVVDAYEAVSITHNWNELRQCMWNYVGIVRSNKRLKRALSRIDLLTEEINDYYAQFRITQDLIELRNLVSVASLIVNSALSRKESRGLHYNLDYPYTFPKALPTILSP